MTGNHVDFLPLGIKGFIEALFFTIIIEHTGLWICSSDFASQLLSTDLPKRTFAMLLKRADI
jgi:hypothetical protein